MPETAERNLESLEVENAQLRVENELLHAQVLELKTKISTLLRIMDRISDDFDGFHNAHIAAASGYPWPAEGKKHY